VASVSVVVPTYNRAALLEETLHSIFAQTRPVDEIIVVDDGSTDETASVCARQSERVRYLRQENSGLPALARNRGIAEAKGDWIAFCDSDDLWRPDKLEVELAALAATGAKWVVSGFGTIDPEGRRVPLRNLGFEREFPVFSQLRKSADEHFARWLTKSQISTRNGPADVYAGDAFGMLFEGNVCLTSSAVMARDLVARSGPFDPVFIRAEDTEFFHRVSAYAPVAIVMQALLEYRIGHPSVMSARDLSPFMRFTLESLERAARLRPEMTASERNAHRRGRERLRMTLAYERLSSLDQPGARQALFDGWRNREIISPRAFALLIASFIPTSGLKTLHAAKRGLRTAMRTRLWTRRDVEPKVVRVRTVANDHHTHVRSTTDGGDAE
jgi:glycosyltransferase involved in cell wall biosynthesis